MRHTTIAESAVIAVDERLGPRGWAGVSYGWDYDASSGAGGWSGRSAAYGSVRGCGMVGGWGGSKALLEYHDLTVGFTIL